MRLTIAYSKIKKRNLVLINNDTYQRETLSERPIRQPLSCFRSLFRAYFILFTYLPYVRVYKRVSSTYISTEHWVKIVGISFMKGRNSIGLRIEPWGTPAFISCVSERTSLMITHCYLNFVKKWSELWNLGITPLYPTHIS